MFLLVEGFRCGGEHRDFVGADGARAVVALFVRHQHRIAHAVLARDAGEDFGGIGELRHPLRADEARGFDRATGRSRTGDRSTRSSPAVGTSVFSFCSPSRGPTSTMRTRSSDITRSSSVTRTASASTKSPATARTSAMRPSRGALRLSSIFIASITRTSSPARTLSPARAFTTTTRPGIGREDTVAAVAGHAAHPDDTPRPAPGAGGAGRRGPRCAARRGRS